MQIGENPSQKEFLFPIYLKASPRQLIAQASVADHEFLEAPSKQDQTFHNLIRRLQRLEASCVVIWFSYKVIPANRTQWLGRGVVIYVLAVLQQNKLNIYLSSILMRQCQRGSSIYYVIRFWPLTPFRPTPSPCNHLTFDWPIYYYLHHYL